MMTMGTYFIAAFILFACILPKFKQISGKSLERKATVEKFKLLIKEGSAKFYEEIEVDEENDIAYFKVPPHNGLSEADRMYDFKMNITVSRVKSDRVCYIAPLPQDLPRPNIMARGLKKLENTPPSHKIKKVSHQWRIGDRVEKWSLRREVQEFCGQFPVYRLEPFTPDSVTVVSGDDDTPVARKRRQSVVMWKLCSHVQPPCHPNTWVHVCKIVRLGTCVYFKTCKLDQYNEVLSCSALTEHKYDSVLCCTPSCS